MSPKKNYPAFQDVPSEARVKGEHIWIEWTPKGAPDPWVLCRWCQHFKHAVKHSPCTGPMKVHLN